MFRFNEISHIPFLVHTTHIITRACSITRSARDEREDEFLVVDFGGGDFNDLKRRGKVSFQMISFSLCSSLSLLHLHPQMTGRIKLPYFKLWAEDGGKDVKWKVGLQEGGKTLIFFFFYTLRVLLCRQINKTRLQMSIPKKAVISHFPKWAKRAMFLLLLLLHDCPLQTVC